MQRALEQVHVEESLGYYIVDLVAATRSAPGVQVGSSPRGSLALLKLARCRAALAGRDYATPDDVKAVAVPALAHRLSLRPELWVERRRSDDIVRELLDRCRRRRSSSPSARVTRAATAKLRVYSALAGLGPARRAGARPAGARRAGCAVRRSSPASASRSPAPPSVRVVVELDRERQLEARHGRPRARGLAARTRVERLELLLGLPDGLGRGSAEPAC